MNAVVKATPVEQPVSESSALMRLIETATLRDDFDVEKLEKLLAVKKDWEANEARKAFVAAMAAFKADAPTIVKDKRVEFSGTKYTHASIGNVVGVITGALGRHGLSHRWDTKQENGLITVTCVITHQFGHSEAVSLSGKPDDSGKKNAIQQTASTVSYLQRYTLLSATGLATVDQEDDDGHGSGEEGETEAHKIELAWIQKISESKTLDEHAATRQAVIDDYRGMSNVPELLRKALVARKRELEQPA